MRPLFRIAEAQLLGRPRQALVALTSVAIGSGMLIVTLSLTAGLSRDFVVKTTETSPHVEVLGRRPPGWRPERLAHPGEDVFALTRHHQPDEKQAVRDVAGVTAALSRMPGVRLVSPAVDAQVVLLYGTVRRAAALSGVIAADEPLVTAVPSKVVAGSWDDLARTADGVVMGRSLARALGVQVGAHLAALGPAGGEVPLRVVALVATGLSRIDKTLAVVNLPLAQGLAGLGTDQATIVRVKLDDALRAPEVARAAQGRLDYVCRSWQEKSAASVEAFERQNRITLVLVLFTTLVAAFGVANVLVQQVSDKRRDIAILRAAGFPRGAVIGIYLIEGALLGVAGAACGWVAGSVLIRVVAAIPVDFGENAVMRNEHLQMVEEPHFYLIALVLSVVVCTIAAVAPARRAARLEPTAILRGER